MFSWLSKFHKDQSGAVSVDKMVLAALVIGLSWAGVNAARDGMTALAQNSMNSTLTIIETKNDV